jgi:hypothetical protein
VAALSHLACQTSVNQTVSFGGRPPGRSLDPRLPFIQSRGANHSTIFLSLIYIYKKKYLAHVIHEKRLLLLGVRMFLTRVCCFACIANSLDVNL